MQSELAFGILTLPNAPWPTMVRRWQYIEALGLDSVWMCDHFVDPLKPDGPWYEGWTSLAGLAAYTQRIRVGMLVTSAGFRNPALLAKQALTVDHLTNGRLNMGLGAGNYEQEYRMMGLSFPGPRERVERFQEIVEIVDRLLRGDNVTHMGQHYHIADASLCPKPMQRPRPPLTLAGKGPKMLKAIAHYADTWNFSGTVEEMQSCNRILEDECAAIGRSPDSIRRSLHVSPAADPRALSVWESVDHFTDIVGRYRSLNVTEFTLYWPVEVVDADTFTSPVIRGLEKIASEAMPRLRSAVAIVDDSKET